MKDDFLKSAWAELESGTKTNTELRSMIKENSHPVLRRIRNQLVIEIIAFSLFLFVYYDFFDGDRRPVYVNVILVAAVLLVIGHNVFGYIWAKRPARADNLRLALESRLDQTRRYTVVSVIIRSLAAICLLIFFSSAISFDTSKYIMLAVVLLVFCVQLFLLVRLWKGRAAKMRHMIGQLMSLDRGE